ncbi:arylformamidase [Variovorax paradoxus]|uniref:Arylformamidase n=1 Tax=Variovorax paradoxus TaxID=34073 RepID=A0AAE4BWE0_VARPD|nr:MULTISPECIES: alpha/beta hydrolase [Variovorax]MBD9666253.1 alpha/beta hydrolase [Variovorax sp. VRV01]MDR6424759.1 arylformamidase [Variovorax paradoxus]
MASYEPAWLEGMYNNLARVKEHPAYFARWGRDSQAVRETLPGRIDVPYGQGVNETLDIFPAPVPGAPVLVFIHGGYWRAMDKRDHSFIAPAFNDRGVCVVMPNYALCPGTAEAPVTVPGILMQMVRALEWTWRHAASFGADPSRITVAGHSAGGHMAAALLACDWKAVSPDLPVRLVRNALSISGLYDLRPLQRTPFLENVLKLSDADALRASPALWPAPARGQLHALVGGDESKEFIRHNALIRDAWGRNAVPVCESLPGLNHFSIVDALADPAHRLHRGAAQLLEA